MASRFSRVMARLPTYLTYVRERPSWLFVLLVGRILAVRKFERWLYGGRRRPIIMPDTTRLQVNGPDRIIDDLEVTGVSARLSLSEADTLEIRSFAEGNVCTTRLPPIRSFLPGDVDVMNVDRPRDVIAAYYFDAVTRCRAIAAIEADPLLTAIAGAYIGAKPHHIRTRLWWSFPGLHVVDADLHASAQERYHFDLNGFRTLKFFFYITDVDSGFGPHAYIAGSHLRRKLRHQFTMMVGHDEEQLRAFYRDDDFRRITGPAGTGFAENPFIFHAGQMCIAGPRLLLEIEFGPGPASASYRYGVLG